MYRVIYAPSTGVHSLCLDDNPIPVWWKEPSARFIEHVKRVNGIVVYDQIPTMVRNVFEPYFNEHYNFDEIETAIIEHLKTFKAPVAQ